MQKPWQCPVRCSGWMRVFLARPSDLEWPVEHTNGQRNMGITPERKTVASGLLVAFATRSSCQVIFSKQVSKVKPSFARLVGAPGNSLTGGHKGDRFAVSIPATFLWDQHFTDYIHRVRWPTDVVYSLSAHHPAHLMWKLWQGWTPCFASEVILRLYWSCTWLQVFIYFWEDML